MSRRLAFATLHRLKLSLPVAFRADGLSRRTARRMVDDTRDGILTVAISEVLSEAADRLDGPDGSTAAATAYARDRLDEAESLRALLTRRGRRALREFDR